MAQRRCRIGLVGFGSLGQYLAQRILTDPLALELLELAFVWNRNATRIAESGLPIPAELICHSLSDVAGLLPDLIVEVSHPEITQAWGIYFIKLGALLSPARETMSRPTLIFSSAGFMCGWGTAF